MNVSVPAHVMVTGVSIPYTLDKSQYYAMKVYIKNYGSSSTLDLYAQIKLDSNFLTPYDSVYIGTVDVGASDSVTFVIQTPAYDTIGGYTITLASPNTATDGFGSSLQTATHSVNTSLTEVTASNIGLTVYPNPLKKLTNISYTLPMEATVDLALYDICGRRIATLIDGKRQLSGKHIMQYYGDGLESGVYLLKLTADDYSTTQRVEIVK